MLPVFAAGDDHIHAFQPLQRLKASALDLGQDGGHQRMQIGDTPDKKRG